MALFRRKKKAVEEAPILEETASAVEAPEQATEEESYKTTLSFHPDWEITPQERYVYQFQHEQLPILKPNQISITGIRLLEYNEGFVVVALLRNTLPKAVLFEEIDLLLLDENNQTIAKKRFDMDLFGELPALHCRPWRFLFSKEDKLSETIPQEGWKIAFELRKKQEPAVHRLELAESWENEISEQQKEHLRTIVSQLPALQVGEVNFMGIQAVINEKKEVFVTLLIRNGSNRDIKLDQIPLIVEDATGDVVCKGSFRLEDFHVKANTSKPWTFVFPSSLLLKEQPDFTKFKVYPPQQQEQI